MADQQPVQLDMSTSVPVQRAPSPPNVHLDMGTSVPVTPEPSAIQKFLTTGPEDYMTGAAKELLQPAVGIGEALNKIPVVGEYLAPREGIEREREMLQPKGTAEKVGGLVEQAGEFALGEGALKEVGAVLRAPQWLLAAMNKYPKAAKLLMESVRAGSAGAAQGAAHAGAEGKSAVSEAEAGGIGGAIGGAAGSAIEQGAMRWLARTLGVGGLGAEEAMTMAGRPSVPEARQGRWDQALKRALPGIVQDAKAKGFKNLQEFTDIVQDRARDLWTNTIEPQIARHANEQLSGASVANRVRSALRNKEGMAWAMTPEIFESETEGVKKIAKSFDNFNYTLEQADQLREALNKKLSKYYRATAEQKATMRMTDGDVNAMRSAADALRDQIYGRLSALGEQTPAKLRQEYGALKDIQRVFESRVPVDARQAPINVTQAIALISGMADAFTGEGVSATAKIATAGAAKLRNRPVSLVRQALEAAAPGPVRRFANAARGVAGEAGGFAGAQLGRATVRASDGTLHSFPVDQLDAARKIDPNLEILNGPENK